MRLHDRGNLTPSLEALGFIHLYRIFILPGSMNTCHLETGLYTLSKTAHWVISAGP